MADPFDSPVDVEADDAGLSGLAQMAAALVFALVTLAVLNAHAFAAWADALEPGTRSARIGAVADGFADRTAAGGLDVPRAALNAGWNRVKAARWPNQDAPE
ncbi:hypothetical protein [Sandarakinorhabdus sp.]|jgi:peroxiredoxin|uniref:hypothetical protein n=1 Tax=Sandarakinorhabdus sp. TaxID=1916663 RepID=UPI00356A46EA